mmetsp:Transcript_46899/g.77845  ORF Transcript_46899/g.77845 Transcript_46899/m.77845 type:complete len:300 (-) Transcript_46899:56-955(-)
MARAISIFFTCLAYASHGYRPQNVFEHSERELHESRRQARVLNPLTALSTLLVTGTNPAIGWQFSGRLPALRQPKPESISHQPARKLWVRAPPPMAADLNGPFPKLVVLDLDMCVWQPEMYTLDMMPDRPIRGDLGGRGEGVIGVHSGGDVIKMFPGALKALQEVADGKYEGMQLAVASSADTRTAEKIGRAAMEMLEVLPGVTMKDVITRGFEDGRNLQIGRQPPLSSDKARTHFPFLKENTGVPYDQMLFFDDSNWGDHCAAVEKGCPGVVTQRTPNGMLETEWRNGLRKFAEKQAG